MKGSKRSGGGDTFLCLDYKYLKEALKIEGVAKSGEMECRSLKEALVCSMLCARKKENKGRKENAGKKKRERKFEE